MEGDHRTMIPEEMTAVLDALVEPALLLDCEGRVLYANMPAQLRFNITTGEGCFRVLHSEAAQCPGCSLPTVAEEVGRVRVCRFYWQGTRLGMRLTNIGGGRILAVLAEATPRKKTQASDALASVLDAIGDMVVLTDRQGKIEHVNAAFEQRLGISRAAVVGRRYAEVWPSDGAIEWDSIEQRVLGRGEVVLFRGVEYKKPLSGEPLSLNLTFVPKRDGAGGVQGMIAIIHSASEELRLASRLREVEHLYQNLFDAIPMGLLIIGRDRKTRLINATARRFLGEDCDLQHMPFESVLAPEDRERVLVDFRRVLETRRPYSDGNTFFVRNGAGERRRVFVRSSVLDFKGEQCLLVATLDITESYRTDEQLLREEQLAALGSLAAAVAHEFNNVLAAVQGRAELIVHHADGSVPIIPDCARAIVRHCRRASRIVDQVHGVATMQAPKPTSLRWEDIAEDVLGSLAPRLAEENITVERDYKATAGVWADAGQIHQLVLNLLQNAREAIRPQGQGTIRVSTRDVDDAVAFDIEDTGTGMDEATKARIFEPFFSAKRSRSSPARQGSLGLGLGLTIVHQVVRANNGRIEVASTPGKGTRFTIVLPRSVEPIDFGVSQPEHPLGPGRTLRVAVLDDDEDVTEMITLALATRGIRAFPLNEGHRAVERCLAVEADVLVIDRNLPPVDGLDILRELRRRGLQIPAILLSGRQSQEPAEELRLLGVVKQLTKPVGLSDLFVAIDAAAELSSRKEEPDPQ